MEEEAIRVVRVVCGCYHTLFVCGAGRLHACGDNSRGQCGLGPLSHATAPALVPLPKWQVGTNSERRELRVVLVACGRYASALMCLLLMCLCISFFLS